MPPADSEGQRPLEIELKFQVPAARREALRRAVATTTSRTTRLQAFYGETPDRRLAAAGLALRLRKEGRVWVQTLKGRGDDLMSRLEHEVRLPPQKGAPTLDPQRHAGTPAGAALLRALGDGAELQPLYRTDIHRLHRRLRFGGALIEVAYDHGQIIAGGERLAVDEIEFELLGGPPQALAVLAGRWAARFGLWWDGRTKSERGFRLALGLAQVPPVKARRAAWPAGAGPHQVWQAALQSALAQALANGAEIASGAGAPEHLHQLRVALRRLRSVLRELAAWGGDVDEARALEAAWRGPFGQLGAARDADVIAAMRPRLLAAGAPEVAWPPSTAGPTPEEVVRGAEFNALMLRSLALSLAPVPPAAEMPPLPGAARAVLRPAWRRLLEDASAFAAADAPRQHRTRKRLKRLRYTLEALLPLFRRKPAQRLLSAIGLALDALGELNDLQTAESLWQRRAAEDPAAWFAVGWLTAQREQAVVTAASALARLAKAPRPWREKESRR